MSEKQHNKAIGRFCRLIEALAGHEFDPLSTGEVAAALKVAKPTATRDLQTAQNFGWVEQAPDGKWRLAPRKITDIAVAVQHGIQRAKSRLDDQANHYTRSTYW